MTREEQEHYEKLAEHYNADIRHDRVKTELNRVKTELEPCEDDMTIEEAKSILLNTAWLGTNKDREKTEEAVKVLIAEIEQESHNQTKADVLTDINNKYRDTLDMAIKALEQEPCEDCISFEAVKNTMFMVQRTAFISDSEFLRTLDLLMCLPFVTPAKKTGHWKRVSIDKYTESAKYWYKCDKCGEKHLGNTNFCPNCGAKMSEVSK